MYVYTTVPAAIDAVSNASTAPMYTTAGTANNFLDHLRFLTVSPRSCSIQGFSLLGRGAGLTAISGIQVKVIRMSTASTVGTAATPHPRDPGTQAAVTTPFTLPTVGTASSTQLVIGCGAAGPGGWTAMNPDSCVYLATAGGANGNVDFAGASGTVSLNFDMTVEHFE